MRRSPSRSPSTWLALLLSGVLVAGCREDVPTPQDRVDETTLARRALEEFGARLASVYRQNAEARRKAAADSTPEEARFWAPSDAMLEALFTQAAESQGLTAARLGELVDANPELRKLQARVVQEVILGAPSSDAGVLESAGARRR